MPMQFFYEADNTPEEKIDRDHYRGDHLCGRCGFDDLRDLTGIAFDLTGIEARRIVLRTRYNLPRRYSLIPAHIANTMRTPIAL